MNAEWIVILTALIAAAPGVYAMIAGRHKVNSEAADSISGAAVQLVEPLRCENAALRKQVDGMRSELDGLRREMDDLRTENATLRVDVGQLREDNVTLRTAISALRAENEELVEGVAALAQQVQALGQRPVFAPRKRGNDDLTGDDLTG